MNRARRPVAVLATLVGISVTAPAVLVPATFAAASVIGVTVVSCRAELGAPGAAPPRSPSKLPIALDARDSNRVRFYSDGFVTVLAPNGWSCAGLEAADGSQSLSVFPTGQRDPVRGDPLPTRGAAVTAVLDYTGHGPGAELVCGLFPGTRAATLAGETGGCPPVPSREQVTRPTADVATFLDPAGVRGSGLPSGGKNAAVGVVLFPQVSPEPGSVNVAKATCTAPGSLSSICDLVVADFVARNGSAQQPTG
jgi:hypothetical protein